MTTSTMTVGPASPLVSTSDPSIVQRLLRPDLGRWLAQAQAVRGCSRPVRLVGTSDRISALTGEVIGSYASSAEPDGVTYTRCGNRRQSMCQSCSHEYKGDVWHVLMAGAAGGIKGVPEHVAAHPLVFATLTAPSFGPVHAAKKPGRPGSRRCRPRSGDRRQLCPHGRKTWCMAIHDHVDPIAGQPLCQDCYDYTAHLIWQWLAPELWRRFTIALGRHVAHRLGVSEKASKKLVRVQFSKVAEFQARGIIHFHALIRLDGPPTDVDLYPVPTVDLDGRDLADLVQGAAKAVYVDAPPVDRDDHARWLLKFGVQVDARPVTSTADPQLHGAALHPGRVAAYIAKYATKAAADLPGRNPHLQRLRASMRALAGRAAIAAVYRPVDAVDPYKGWGKWGDMLGFRGHLATKSRRYSVTLGSLRQARQTWARRRDTIPHEPPSSPAVVVDHDDQGDDEDTILVVGSWRFAGMGWLTSGDAALAAASAARAREG